MAIEPNFNNFKSQDWLDGYVTGLVWISDIFSSHSNAFMKKGLLRKKDITLIVNIIDAAIKRRETLAEVGPRNMHLFVGKDRSASLKEK